MITVVGLGNGCDECTVAGLEAMQKARKVFLKTAFTKSAETLVKHEISFAALDDLYVSAQSFEELNEKICDVLLAEKNAVYCVNGNGYDDLSVKALQKKTKVKIIGAPAQGSPLLSLCPGEEYLIFSATEFVREESPLPDRPLVVREIDDAFLAGELKLKLADFYGDEQEIWLLEKGKPRPIAVFELDRQKHFTYDTAVLVLPRPFTQKLRYGIADVQSILRRLRAPDGCPWYRAQTHETLRTNAVEEAYELADAIDHGDTDAMREETGDLLLQPLFHLQLASESGAFDTQDCTTELCKKLIGRHTHVFGEDRATDSATALEVWTKNKLKEKSMHSVSDTLEAVPAAFPALMKAQKLQKRAAKGGLDFENQAQILQKLQEELAELQAADAAAKEEEAGDLLFSAVNLVRFYGVDAEIALNAANRKFLQRVESVERFARADGKEMQDCTPSQLDAYWQKAKNENEAVE